MATINSIIPPTDGSSQPAIAKIGSGGDTLFIQTNSADAIAINTTQDVTLSNTGAALLPTGNTAARPASPANGMMRYNTQKASGVVEAYVNGSWVNVTTPQPVSINYLVVAGGGGGGGSSNSTSSRGGAGGGAGGVLSGSATLTANYEYFVTVGAGGAGGTGGVVDASVTKGVAGQASSIINSGAGVSISATGGGGGGGSTSASSSTVNGDSGGSGGGASFFPAYFTGVNGGGVSGQGYAGGNVDQGVGGGGGSTQLGETPATIKGGNGGSGTTNTTIPGLPNSGLFGGGGGGGSNGNSAAGTASYGGGAGGYNTSATANGYDATANTGGGGGGGGGGVVSGAYAGSGGAGASGFVAIQVPNDRYTGAYTGTPTIDVGTTYTTLVFTSNGSYLA